MNIKCGRFVRARRRRLEFIMRKNENSYGKFGKADEECEGNCV